MAENTVRIHGTTDREKLKAATAKFMKKAIQAKQANKRGFANGKTRLHNSKL
jgi:hypothetical protein